MAHRGGGCCAVGKIKLDNKPTIRPTDSYWSLGQVSTKARSNLNSYTQADAKLGFRNNTEVQYIAGRLC